MSNYSENLMSENQLCMLQNKSDSVGIQFGPAGISIPTPGEPDQWVKNTYWLALATGTLAMLIGGAKWLAGKD